MRKALVTMAIGARFEREYEHLLPLREAWARRHGWDLHVVRSIPEPFVRAHSRSDKPGLGWCCYLYKLQLPEAFSDYDLVAYVDSDIAINPAAPCLSAYESQIPAGGFAAVQTVGHEERRRLFPLWAEYYYDDLVARGFNRSVPNPKLHVSSGVLLFRPRDVAERWSALITLDTDLNEENRLNVYEVQAGRCFLLPGPWHVVWMYERHRVGLEKPIRTVWGRLARKCRKTVRWRRSRESAAILGTLQNCHMLHFGYEHEKVFFLDRNALASLIASESTFPLLRSA